MPAKAISRVRGIGLALKVKTSTPTERDLIASLWVTPKRCSSSTTSRPRSLKTTFSDKSRCVPTTTSIDAVLQSRERLRWSRRRRRSG